MLFPFIGVIRSYFDMSSLAADLTEATYEKHIKELKDATDVKIPTGIDFIVNCPEHPTISEFLLNESMFTKIQSKRLGIIQSFTSLPNQQQIEQIISQHYENFQDLMTIIYKTAADAQLVFDTVMESVDLNLTALIGSPYSLIQSINFIRLNPSTIKADIVKISQGCQTYTLDAVTFYHKHVYNQIVLMSAACAYSRLITAHCKELLVYNDLISRDFYKGTLDTICKKHLFILSHKCGIRVKEAIRGYLSVYDKAYTAARSSG